MQLAFRLVAENGKVSGSSKPISSSGMPNITMIYPAYNSHASVSHSIYE